MKLRTSQATLLGILAAVAAASPATASVTLFADTFDRPDNTDLNATTTGKSGTLGALSWVEKKSSGEPQIISNNLRLGETGAGGGGYSLAYADHNFTDAVITTGGEFTVSIVLPGSIASGGNTRLTGFMVGNSKAEIDGWATSSPTDAAWTSDFFFGYDPTNPGLAVGSYIFDGNTQVFYSNTNYSAAGATLSVRFHGIDDFNAGSTVNYQAFINGGSPVSSGSFTWSGTNENYIALYSNYTLDRGTIGSFEVTAVPEPTSALMAGLLAGCGLLRRRR